MAKVAKKQKDFFAVINSTMTKKVGIWECKYYMYVLLY